MAKTSAKAILLNKDFFSKIRNKKWIRDNGSDAVLILLSFWIASSNEPDCKVKIDEIDLLELNLPFKIDKVRLVLASAVKEGLLDEKDGFYFNSQTVEDHNSFKIKQENYSKGRRKSLDNPDKILGESSENPRRNLEESKKDSLRTPENEYQYQSDINNINKTVSQSEATDPSLIAVGEFNLLHFDPITWEALHLQHQKPVLDRAIQLAESYIEKQKNKDRQKYNDLKNEAKSGKAYLLSWPISQAYEQLSSEKAAKNRLDRSKVDYKKPDQTSRPQPPLVKDIPKQEPLTPEQLAQNRKLVEDLRNKTLGRVGA